MNRTLPHPRNRFLEWLLVLGVAVTSALVSGGTAPPGGPGPPGDHRSPTGAFPTTAFPTAFPTPADTAARDTAAADTAGVKKGDAPWIVSAPHGPADTVRFTATEGTWLNLDVSPDGKTLAFDLLGDLYRLPVSGGRAERITSGPAYDIQPRFSPDGSRILFTSDRDGGTNLWTVAPDGDDPRPVTADGSHAVNSGVWTPDGAYVVGRKRLTDTSPIGTVELWLYHVLGGSGLQVTSKDRWGDANGPVVSPDGRWIYFAGRGRFSYNRNVYAGIWQIQGFDRETGNYRTITDGYGGSGRPAISPDGKTLSFVRRDRTRTILVLHDLESGRERVLFDGLDADLQEGFAWTGTYPGYAWMPDGKGIVISYRGGIHVIDTRDGSTREVPFEAEVEQHVTRALRYPQHLAPDSVRVRMVSWPVQSAPGDRLVFSALGNLYGMRLPGGEPRRLPAEGPRAYAPSFDPSRNRIAYVTWSDVEGGAVRVMDPDGRRSRRVTDVPGQYSNPVFSPDGSKLAFLKGSGASARGRDLGDELFLDVMWVPSGGGRPEFVVSIENRGSSRKMPRLAWSPDGSRIFYNEDTGGYGEKNRTILASIRPDGTDRREHLRIRYAEEIVPSPDGRWVVYSRLHQGYLAALPDLGREPIELTDDTGPVPAHRFSEEGADWLNWSPDGKTITWGFGPYFYRVRLEDVERAWGAKKLEAAKKTSPEAARGEGGDEKGESGGAEKRDGDAGKDKDDAARVRPDTLEVRFEVPRHRPRGTVALRGARLITMNGYEVIPRGTIVIDRDRIAAAGPESEVEVPGGAKVIDVTGKTIIPGIIDVHAHLHYDYLDIIPESVSSYYANLAYGVTTVHDPSASTYAVFTQAEMVEAGVTVGPRVFSTGFVLYGADLPNTAPISKLEDARHHVRRLKTLGAITVKSYMQPRREQRQWVIEAAREESIMVVPEGGGDLEANMTMVLDGHTGLEHAIPVAPLYRDVITLLAESGTGYTPTLLVAYGGLSGEHWFYQHHEVWRDEKLLRFLPRGQVDARARRRSVMATDDDWHHMAVAAGCKAVVEAGGLVQLGAHGQLQGLGVHWELWAFTQGGMSNHDALRVATIMGATYVGLDGWVGSLEAGKLADLVVLDGNPLEDIRNSNTVRMVAKNGEIYDGDTMDRLWPSERPRPPFPWQVQGEMLITPR